MPGGLVEPTGRVANEIFEAYLTNVEPIFRLYHTPTLIAFMRDGASYLGQPWDSPGCQAVKRAVWMAGINSMSEQECLEVTGENKTDAINHYRRLVGISLAQADLVNTTDMVTLQAFITYLVSQARLHHILDLTNSSRPLRVLLTTPGVCGLYSLLLSASRLPWAFTESPRFHVPIFHHTNASCVADCGGASATWTSSAR